MNFINDLKPICFICEKEVESMKIDQDFSTKDTIFLVYCHGDTDIFKLPYSFFQEYDFRVLGRGYAFKTKRIKVK